MDIYEIKDRTRETAPYFFSTETMKFFGQTLKSFRVYKQKSGKFLIVARSGANWSGKHETKRIFNPANNELEQVID